ncbi:MAG TPA: hypothetical protein VGA66_06795, partial [Mycobacterium sp.]
MRAAAGACALSIGLLVCSSGGAIATAEETDSGGKSTESQGDSAKADDTKKTSSTDPTRKLSDQPDDKDPDDDTTAATGTATKVEAQTNTSLDSEDAVGSVDVDSEEAVGSVDVDKDADVVVVVVPAEATPISVTETPPTAATEPPTTEQVAASESTTTQPAESDAAAPATTSASKSGSPTETTATQEPETITTAVFVPVSNAVTTIAQALGAAGLTLASLPGSQTPITDVITAIQIMMNAVVDAIVEVAQVPGNLLNLLGFTAADGVRPPLIGAGGIVAERTPVVLTPLATPQLPQAPIAADAPLFGNVVNASDFGGIAATSLNHELALSGLTPAPVSVSAATTSFLDHVVKSVLVPASLTALAAIAVPGIGGLLIVCAAGIRVGYRQAKASLALRVSGIARFAG